MDEWFGKQDFDLILCTGGNHDYALEDRLNVTPSPFRNAVYLQDQSYVHRGVAFYGSPWTPELRGHAFFQDTDQLEKIWSAIPVETDVLITHTPLAGILDVSSRGLDLGCVHLASELQRVSPRLHCFGHVHASSGVHKSNGVSFINASSVNSQFELVRRPYEFVL
jgi:Icc-related predicted phosphoesterase